MISYLSSTSLITLLKKAMGWSWEYSFFCNRIAARVVSEEKEKILNALVYSGLAKVGPIYVFVLIASNRVVLLLDGILE